MLSLSTRNNDRQESEIVKSGRVKRWSFQAHQCCRNEHFPVGWGKLLCHFLLWSLKSRQICSREDQRWSCGSTEVSCAKGQGINKSQVKNIVSKGGKKHELSRKELECNGIGIYLTTGFSHQENGFSERRNRKIKNAIRTRLMHSEAHALNAFGRNFYRLYSMHVMELLCQGIQIQQKNCALL